MVSVWRLTGNIIRTALCWIVWHNVHSQKGVTTSPNSTQLVWPFRWPQRIKCCGHSAGQLSWVGLGDVVILNSQLSFTEDRKFSVSRELLSILRILTTSLLSWVYRVVTSHDPIQLNSVGQLSDHSVRRQFSWVVVSGGVITGWFCCMCDTVANDGWEKSAERPGEERAQAW